VQHESLVDKWFNNVPNYANKTAFAAIKADGSIMAWGNSNNGGTSALSESGYTKIYSNLYAFAALKADGHSDLVCLMRLIE
jgi:hypothetical protein